MSSQHPPWAHVISMAVSGTALIITGIAGAMTWKQGYDYVDDYEFGGADVLFLSFNAVIFLLGITAFGLTALLATKAAKSDEGVGTHAQDATYRSMR